MSTAGLSKAYAVLRQLESLRLQGIANPLPFSGERCRSCSTSRRETSVVGSRGIQVTRETRGRQTPNSGSSSPSRSVECSDILSVRRRSPPVTDTEIAESGADFHAKAHAIPDSRWTPTGKSFSRAEVNLFAEQGGGAAPSPCAQQNSGAHRTSSKNRVTPVQAQRCTPRALDGSPSSSQGEIRRTRNLRFHTVGEADEDDAYTLTQLGHRGSIFSSPHHATSSRSTASRRILTSHGAERRSSSVSRSAVVLSPIILPSLSTSEAVYGAAVRTTSSSGELLAKDDTGGASVSVVKLRKGLDQQSTRAPTAVPISSVSASSNADLRSVAKRPFSGSNSSDLSTPRSRNVRPHRPAFLTSRGDFISSSGTQRCTPQHKAHGDGSADEGVSAAQPSADSCLAPLSDGSQGPLSTQYVDRGWPARSLGATSSPPFSPPEGDLFSFYTGARTSHSTNNRHEKYPQGALSAAAEDTFLSPSSRSACETCAQKSAYWLPMTPSPQHVAGATPSPPGLVNDEGYCSGNTDSYGSNTKCHDDRPSNGLSRISRSERHNTQEEAQPLPSMSAEERSSCAPAGTGDDGALYCTAASAKGKDGDDEHDIRSPKERLKSTSSSNASRIARVPLFTSAYTQALPYLDYLNRAYAAESHHWQKELQVIGEAWAREAVSANAEDDIAGGAEPFLRKEDSKNRSRNEGEDEVTQSIIIDCLALDFVLSCPAALEYVVVPLLRSQLESLVQSMKRKAGARCDDEVRKRGAERLESASGNNELLCAIIGMGGATVSLFPILLELLLELPPSTPASICDVRLVGLALRTTGATDGVRALLRALSEESRPPHVLKAAAYALGTYAYELVGHTSVLCVPVGRLRHYHHDNVDEAYYRFVIADPQISCGGAPRPPPWPEELRPLWGKSPPLASPISSTGVPHGGHLLPLQVPPPYRPTHICIDAEVVRRGLTEYLGSAQYRSPTRHPWAMVLLHDALDPGLLGAAMEKGGRQRYVPVLSRLHRNFHRVMTQTAGSILVPIPGIEPRAEESLSRGVRATAVQVQQLQLPTLSSSILHLDGGDTDVIFAVESALVHLLLARSATAPVREQALLSLCVMPPEARTHVIQPVTDFFLKLARKLQLRHSTTMRRLLAHGDNNDTNGGYDSSLPATAEFAPCGDRPGADADENLVVAAAIAAGIVCVNDFALSTSTQSCITSLVPVFKELLQSPLWRVRHATCIGLAYIGALTADPSAIVDLFFSLVARRSSFLEVDESCGMPLASNRLSRRPALQPATLVWCIAQQREGGVRALLRLLQDPQLPIEIHDWCAFQLAEVDVRNACGELSRKEAPEAAVLLKEIVQVLGKLIATQGALKEDTVILCVRSLAEVVHRCYAEPAASEDPRGINHLLPFDSAASRLEAVTYCRNEAPNACFTVLTSVLEAAVLPANILKALCLYVCKYGGGHGELYMCEALLESTSVSARTAASFGLRACGAKVIRSIVLGMNDDSFDVRRESFDTLEYIGIEAVVELLLQRPPTHRHQVLAALRNCLLQDVDRLVAHEAAATLYNTLLHLQDAAMRVTE